MPRLFIIACEPSGDSHGAALIRELKILHPDLQIKGLGGPKMREAGVQLLYDMTTISALGLGDVIRQYGTYRKIFYQALHSLESFKPHTVVLIDSPAFNLRFAKKIKKRFPVIYYIAPQIWAWGIRRIHTIKKTISKMLVILPFEKDLYDRASIPCEFVGHPLVDHIAGPGPVMNRLSTDFDHAIALSIKKIGLLPGSREKEVVRIFPLMLETARLLQKIMPDVSFVTRPSPNVPAETYHSILKNYPDVKVSFAENISLQEVVSHLDFALVASGTATLETALIGTPFFLLYKASWSTYFLGKYLVRVPYLGLANLLAGKSIVPEFIQYDIRPENIAHQAKKLLQNPAAYQSMKEEFKKVREMLGTSGASRRAALAVSKTLNAKL